MKLQEYPGPQLPTLDLPGLLVGKTAVITGGADGIGGATTQLFAEAGASVVFADSDADLARAREERVAAAGGRAVAVVGDIRDRSTVERLRETAAQKAAGAVDVLVNNVGDYKPYKRFLESDESDWTIQHDICFVHVLRCSRAFLPAMVERGRGAIVNVSTVEAFRGIPGNAVYSAYKSAIVNFTRSLAVEVGGHGVRVNAIAPDLTHTPQTPMYDWHPDGEKVRCWVPLGRFANPTEQARVALFLASELSSFVTGQTLCVDGGTSAASGWYRSDPGADAWSNTPYMVAPKRAD
jgi:NAD(P)-dependent dehydrogenase (short-subunit alcohol dehydrogenase family)